MFSFIATSTTEIYTLSLHDALPIFCPQANMTGTAILLLSAYDGNFIEEQFGRAGSIFNMDITYEPDTTIDGGVERSEEHTSELQSLRHLVCRLLLEKKKKK